MQSGSWVHLHFFQTSYLIKINIFSCHWHSPLSLHLCSASVLSPSFLLYSGVFIHSIPTPDSLVLLQTIITYMCNHQSSPHITSSPLFLIGLSYELGSFILVAPSILFSLIGLLSYLHIWILMSLCLAEHVFKATQPCNKDRSLSTRHLRVHFVICVAVFYIILQLGLQSILVYFPPLQ